MWNASASLTAKALFTSFRSQMDGTKSSPIPSTSQLPGSTSLPSLTSGVRIDPTGSARMISTFGFLERR